MRLLRDAGGKIIGAAFADTTGIPRSLAAGEKAIATADVTVASGQPVKVEAVALG